MFLLEILLLFATVLLMLSPLFAELLSFNRDRKNKLTHKRFRLLVFSLVYICIITVLMSLFKYLVLWVGSLPFIEWLVNKFSAVGRFGYAVNVFAVILINFAIGAAFKFFVGFVRIGLKKKTLVYPRGTDGDFTSLQKVERKVIKFFNDEKWFLVAKALKFLSIVLTVVYALIFIAYQLPVFWDASWLPYKFILNVFKTGYIYPIISLIPLWQAYFFLSGVELLESECPDFVNGNTGTAQKQDPDVKAIDEGCRKSFADYFVCEVDTTGINNNSVAGECHDITKLIVQGVRGGAASSVNDAQAYDRCLDIIVRNDLGCVGEIASQKTTGILINGSLFSGFSDYFLRYISIVLSRGDNVIFVCNDISHIERTYSYLSSGLEKIYSLSHNEPEKKDITFNNPVWKIRKVNESCNDIEISDVNDCSVLVTELSFLASGRFESSCESFIHLTDTVVFVDTLSSVNGFSHQMSIFDSNMRTAREANAIRAKNSSGKLNGNYVNASDNAAFAVRYMSNQIKYVCFDDSRVPGLDKVLKNLLFVDFISADAMRYNTNALIRCYNYERRLNGQNIPTQSAHTEEDLSVLANIADCAVVSGSDKVTVFAEDNIPFADIAESVAANANNGLSIRENDNFMINSFSVNSDDYRVIVAFDHNDNLPMATRRYLARTYDKPTLIMLFSRPYMFRDYFLENMGELWRPSQLMRIPVEQSGKYNAVKKILINASSGGISLDEIYSILTDAHLADYKDVIKNRSLGETLRKLLSDCGKHSQEAGSWNDYFECVRFCNFNNEGNFVSEERVHLRKKSDLFELLEGASPAKVVIDGVEHTLPLPKNRITQNYIVGQNMLYNGGVYVINNIDVANGKIYIKHATGGKNNIPYCYVQNREYYIDYSESSPERAYATKRLSFNNDGDIAVRDVTISVTRRPMEVLTKGYTAINYSTMTANGGDSVGYEPIDGEDQRDKFNETYRRYGVVGSPVCSSDMIMEYGTDINAFSNGALVMSVKLSGNFGDKANGIAELGAAMLEELLASMFPTVKDTIAVCPVVKRENVDAATESILKLRSKVVCRGYQNNPEDIEFLIIEDCASDMGVISVLMSSGDDVLKTLFSPIRAYLNWYANSTDKSNYLYFGQEKEPECFDFAGLEKLSAALDNTCSEIKFVEAENITQQDTCDFCCSRVDKQSNTVLDDGRKMCPSCAASVVNNDKKVLRNSVRNAKLFLESVYDITVDDMEFFFEKTKVIVDKLKRSNDAINKRSKSLPLMSYVDNKNNVYVEYNIPSYMLLVLIAEEMTKAWQAKHIPNISDELAMGHTALVSIQYLRFLGQDNLAKAKTTIWECGFSPASKGYRKIVHGLLENQSDNNNPFAYLLRINNITPATEITTKPQAQEQGEYGLSYISKQPDRFDSGKMPYFYYSRISETWKKNYDNMLDAVLHHRPSFVVDGITFEELSNVAEAVEYDHPEIFWYRTFSLLGDVVNLKYGASEEEVALIQKRIDEVVPKYLAEIDDSMSAYDVALRLHVKLISLVDYDTAALRKEDAKGGPDKDKIDYLRSMCGVFLNGKAVCEGYVRAMQYLLQKCGVECAELAGHIRKDSGELKGGHAWLIIKIDGEYYHIDTTWDDGSNTVQTVKNNHLGFDYFCITTAEAERTRAIDMCPVNIPVCDSFTANYYRHNGFYLESYDMSKVKEIALAAAKNLKRSFSIKLSSKALYDRYFVSLCSNPKDCFDILKAVSKQNKNIRSDKYTYCYDKNLWSVTVKFKYK